MLKSYYKYFIRNGQLVSSEKFSPDIICEGISIYEVIRLIDKVPLFFNEHLERFNRTATEVKKEISIKKEQILSEIQKLSDENKVINGNVEIILNYCGEDKRETNIIYLFIEQRYPSEEDYKYGVGAGVYEKVREQPQIKQINFKLRKDTSKRINENGFYEVILLRPDGEITEGSRSNIFFIKDNKIFTPPLDLVLPGITRQKIFELCKDNNIEIIEQKIHKYDLPAYDAAFLSGTSPRILPLRFVDHCLFNVENNLLRRIINLYNELIEQYVNRHQSMLQ